MIHADASITKDDVKDEIEWVGNACELMIIRRENNPYSEKRKKVVLGDLIDQFTEKFCPPDKRGISINTDGEIKFYSYIDLPKLFTHPEEWKLNCFYKLNLEFSNCLEIDLKNTKLIFNINKWEILSTHDQELIPLASTFFEHFSKEKVKKFVGFDGKIKSYFKEEYDFRMLSYEPPGTKYIISFYTFQLLTQNNFKAMFMEKLKSALNDTDFSDSDVTFLQEIITKDYVAARTTIFEECSVELRSKILNFLDDIYIACYHAESEKIIVFTETSSEVFVINTERNENTETRDLKKINDLDVESDSCCSPCCNPCSIQ